jgi:hypothetical protein
LLLIQQLDLLIDPRFHAILQREDSLVFIENWVVSLTAGQAPMFLPCAGVTQVISALVRVCGYQHWPIDEGTLTLIATRIVTISLV